MGDDNLSASELRQRYLSKDGGLSDSQLSAAQLRARHGIASNQWKDQEMKGKGGGGGSSVLTILILVVVAALVGGIVYMLAQR